MVDMKGSELLTKFITKFLIVRQSALSSPFWTFLAPKTGPSSRASRRQCHFVDIAQALANVLVPQPAVEAPGVDVQALLLAGSGAVRYNVSPDDCLLS